MNHEPFVSIIIPVYNAGEYLDGCLAAILQRQDYEDFELILVNDGSTDNSPEICDQYAAQHSRIRAIHQANNGASSARNAGLRASAGKYILFIDADDYIEDFSLNRIAALIEEEGEVDLVLLNTVNVYPDGAVKQRERFTKTHFYKLTHADVLRNMTTYLPDCVWGKLIKREIILQNDIFFEEGIVCEDVDFNFKLFLHAKSYNVGEFPYYYYRTGRDGSVMNTFQNKVFADLLFILTKWDGLSERCYREHRAILRSWIFNNFCWALLTRYRKLAPYEKRKYRDHMKRLIHIAGYSKILVAVLIRAGYRLFGLKAASLIAAVYAYLFIW